jgi:transposase
MNCIGLDIGKSSISVHVPKNSLDLTIDNSIKSLRSFYAKLKKIYKKEVKDIVFIYEPTSYYSDTLYRFCAEKKIKTFKVNPKQSHNFAKAIFQRGKSDKVDAKMLSRAIVIARKGDIVIPTINPLVDEINELIGYYKLKVKQRVGLSNHLESIKAKNVKSTISKRLSKEIKNIKKEEKRVIEDIYELISKDETILKKYNSIISIAGIGKISAILLIYLFLKYPNTNQREITSLTGLDPIKRESGTSIRGKSRISKAGGRIYRSSLFMAAMVSIQIDDRMKAFYDRLKNNNKHTTVAQVAVMRKLLIIAHSLYKSGELYDKEYDIYQKSKFVA